MTGVYPSSTSASTSCSSFGAHRWPPCMGRVHLILPGSQPAFWLWNPEFDIAASDMTLQAQPAAQRHRIESGGPLAARREAAKPEEPHRTCTISAGNCNSRASHVLQAEPAAQPGGAEPRGAGTAGRKARPPQRAHGTDGGGRDGLCVHGTADSCAGARPQVVADVGGTKM